MKIEWAALDRAFHPAANRDTKWHILLKDGPLCRKDLSLNYDGTLFSDEEMPQRLKCKVCARMAQAVQP